MWKVPAFTYCVLFPSHLSTSGLVLAEVWPRHQLNRIQQWEAVLRHLHWRRSQFSLHKSRESITVRSNSEQETIFSRLYFTTGSFQLSYLTWNMCLNALKSFEKENVCIKLCNLKNKESLGIAFLHKDDVIQLTGNCYCQASSGMEMSLLWIRQILLFLLLITSELMIWRFVLQLGNQLI